MFLIIIHVFQMDIICVLIKCYFHVYYHNSWHFMDIICILMKYYFHAYDRNSCISKILYLYFN